MSDRKTSSVLQALVSIAAIGGFAGPSGYVEEFNRRTRGLDCPNCSKGKLTGRNGVRYCQRCSYMEVPL